MSSDREEDREALVRRPTASGSARATPRRCRTTSPLSVRLVARPALTPRAQRRSSRRPAWTPRSPSSWRGRGGGMLIPSSRSRCRAPRREDCSACSRAWPRPSAAATATGRTPSPSWPRAAPRPPGWSPRRGGTAPRTGGCSRSITTGRGRGEATGTATTKPAAAEAVEASRAGVIRDEDDLHGPARVRPPQPVSTATRAVGMDLALAEGRIRIGRDDTWLRRAGGVRLALGRRGVPVLPGRRPGVDGGRGPAPGPPGRLGTDPGAIAAYEALFFAVRDRLDRPDRIIAAFAFGARLCDGRGRSRPGRQGRRPRPRTGRARYLPGPSPVLPAGEPQAGASAQPCRCPLFRGGAACVGFASVGIARVRGRDPVATGSSKLSHSPDAVRSRSSFRPRMMAIDTPAARFVVRAPSPAPGPLSLQPPHGAGAGAEPVGLDPEPPEHRDE